MGHFYLKGYAMFKKAIPIIPAVVFFLESLNLASAQPPIKKETVRTGLKQDLDSQTTLQETQRIKTSPLIKADIRIKGKRIFLELNQSIRKAEVFSEGRKIGELGAGRSFDITDLLEKVKYEGLSFKVYGAEKATMQGTGGVVLLEFTKDAIQTAVSNISGVGTSQIEIKNRVERKISEEGGAISDVPVIQEFSITPNFWVQGQIGEATIRWRVEPTAGGSPISSVTITGPELNYTSSNSTGQYNVNILAYPYPTTLNYTLTAVNAEGKTSTRQLNFEVKSPVEIREQISFERVYTEPASFPEGWPYTVIFSINNRSPVRLSGVLIQIKFTNFIPWAVMAPPSDETPAHIELREQVINPGVNEYRFTDTLSVINGPWAVGNLRGQYFIDIYYYDFLMLCCPVPILDILVDQTEPGRLFRIQRH